MPRKKNGLLYEVHPTPAKGKDGRNIVYVRPAGKQKLTLKVLDEWCSRNYHSRYGELQSAFDYFLRAAGELMARGYRIETPIGSFAPRLALVREVTDPDEVLDRDVAFDGVDYNPGKLWNREFEKWGDGFCRWENPNTQVIMADKEHLEAVLRQLLERDGYTTVNRFARATNLTYYSARKLLNEWCKGDSPKLLKTQRSKEFIYTET